jgi:hypothetical protein
MLESQLVFVEDGLALKKGDRVYVCKKEDRVDDQETYYKVVGEITDVFNAWDPKLGDRWQYRIKGDKGQYISFYEGVDTGSIEVVPKKWGEQ